MLSELARKHRLTAPGSPSRCPPHLTAGLHPTEAATRTIEGGASRNFPPSHRPGQCDRGPVGLGFADGPATERRARLSVRRSPAQCAHAGLGCGSMTSRFVLRNRAPLVVRSAFWIGCLGGMTAAEHARSNPLLQFLNFEQVLVFRSVSPYISDSLVRCSQS